MSRIISIVFEGGVFVPEEKVDLPERTRLTNTIPIVPACKRRYDFADLCGKLTWTGDPVSVQRKLREEW